MAMPVARAEQSSVTSLSERLAWRVRELRVDRGLSQTELARVMGCRQTTISAIENRKSGEATFSLGTLEQLAWALEVDLVVEFRERERVEVPA